ncbi:MAG: hypothetical protein ACHQ1H_00280 [Nitrososphaerales archaeon]
MAPATDARTCILVLWPSIAKFATSHIRNNLKDVLCVDDLGDHATSIAIPTIAGAFAF